MIAGSCTDSNPYTAAPNQSPPTASTPDEPQDFSVHDAVDSNVASDALEHAIASDNWDDYEKELRNLLSKLQRSAERTDRRFAYVTEVIDRKVATSDGIGDHYVEWRTKNARLILASYTPKSTRLLARLTSNLALGTERVHGEVTSFNAEHRHSDAKLILQSIKAVSDSIESDFDPSDPDNQPIAPVPVPGGNYLPGTAPASIADPVIRGSYLRAIAENNAKAARIDTQLQVREDGEKIQKAALRFLREAYSLPPAAFEELEELLDQLKIDPTLKADIVRTVRTSVPRIEMKLKENRQNQENLTKLKAEGLLD